MTDTSRPDAQLITTMTKDYLGRELADIATDARDYLGRTTAAGDTDYLGRVLLP